MLVDLARNDIARVAEPGSRIVTELLTVEKYDGAAPRQQRKRDISQRPRRPKRISCDDEYGDADRCAEN